MLKPKAHRTKRAAFFVIGAIGALELGIIFQCGDYSRDRSLEEQAFNNVAHHFAPAQNVDLAKKVALALAPSGVYCIGEFLRANSPGAGGAVAATMDLYFALTSASGTWSFEEITSWQREAGLDPLK